MDARTWHCRPSDLLAIDDEYVAYCLDQAVSYFGRMLEADLDGVEGKDAEEQNWKRKRILDRYLNGGEEKPSPGQFADPAAMFK